MLNYTWHLTDNQKLICKRCKRLIFWWPRFRFHLMCLFLLPLLPLKPVTQLTTNLMMALNMPALILPLLGCAFTSFGFQGRMGISSITVAYQLIYYEEKKSGSRSRIVSRNSLFMKVKITHHKWIYIGSNKGPILFVTSYPHFTTCR